MSTTNYTISTTTNSLTSTSTNINTNHVIVGDNTISSLTPSVDHIKIGNVESFTITSSDLIIPEYYFNPKIIDINVYGHDKPKVVEVEFKYQHDTVKIKSICCDEDDFDLKKGVYIALSKLLHGKEYTTEGVEEKAHELSLKKDNEKMINKAIKDYYKKLKDKEEAERKEEQERLAKLKRKKKNEERKRRRKEKAQNELKKLIKEATTD